MKGYSHGSRSAVEIRSQPHTPRRTLSTASTTNLRSLTIAFGLRAFATSLVNVFLPLLMLQRGASLRQICLFYIAYSAVKLVIEYPSFISIERHSMAFGVSATLVATVGYLLLLSAYIEGAGRWAILLAPAAQAVMNAYLWNTQHIYLSRTISAPRLARDMARLSVITQMATLTGPPVGGALAELAGQRVLVLTAILVSLVAVLPAWSIHSLPQAHTIERLRLRPILFRDLLANLAFNAQSNFNFFLWPLYLAIVIGQFAGIGIVTAAIDVISLALMLVAGRRSDKGSTHRVLVEGALGSMAGYAMRIFATTTWGIALIGGVSNTAMLYQNVPWTSTYYEHARRLGSRYILWMEFAGDLGYLLVWIVLAAATYTASSSHTFFTEAFLFAAVCCLGCLLINRRRSSDDEYPSLELATHEASGGSS
jgi:MFS family permease